MSDRTYRRRLAPLIPGVCAIALAAAVVASPDSALQASLAGLKLWWNLVFPALLPFLVLTEMLLASGLLHMLGVPLEPVMRRMFRLPGTAGGCFAVGAAAGAPSAAAAAAGLHRSGGLTARQGAAAAALAHFASPASIVIVVGAGLLGSPVAGYGLLLIHWLSGLLAAWAAAAALPGLKAADAGPAVQGSAGGPEARKASPLWSRMRQAGRDARQADGRSFGRLLGEAVSAAVQQLMLAGGCIIMFAVVARLLLRLLPWLPSWSAGGLLELHLGAAGLTGPAAASLFRAAGPAGEPLLYALLSACLAWGGVSAHLMAQAQLREAGARYAPFAAVRLLHAVFAFSLTVLAWKPFLALQQSALPVFAWPQASPGSSGAAAGLWQLLPSALTLQGAVLLGALLLALPASLLRRRARDN